jgi:hypothetical protein
VQQLEDIFSIVGTNLSVWLSILGLGQTTFVWNCERRNEVTRGITVIPLRLSDPMCDLSVA